MPALPVVPETVPVTGPVNLPVTTAPEAVNADKLFACLQATQDRVDRSVLAAALVLHGDQRGTGPLAEALKSGTTAANVEPAAVLLKAIDDHTAATAAPQAPRKVRREKRRG